MSSPEPIFCCESAVPPNPSKNIKLHRNPDRELHSAIYQSFLAFAERRQRSTALMSLILGMGDVSSKTSSLSPSTKFPHQKPVPVLTTESLKNNPITPSTDYVMHLVSRHDFGPVISHRYFVCPPNLHQDWTEASQVHWFAMGGPFNVKAEQWDLKCTSDSKFYRMTLMPARRLKEPPAAVKRAYMLGY